LLTMLSTNLDFANGSVMNALSQFKGILGEKNSDNSGKKSSVAHDDLIIYARFIQENVNILRNAEIQPEAEIEVSEINRKKFANLLYRTTRMNEGLSRQDRIFMQRFWDELLFDEAK